MLHGVRDLDAALRHLRWLLAPGGLLLFEESTSWNLVYNVSNALLEGLSRHEDGWRSDVPFISPRTWEAALRGTGYDRFAAWPKTDEVACHVMLAGMHPGCQELFASKGIRSIRDLKGKSVAVLALNNAQHGFLVSIVGHVGLDPRRDINWIVLSEQESIRQLADGKVDAFIASPPTTYELRAQRIGHVLVNMTTDRPWSQYFCCVLTGNREFIRRNPVATKRAMRAIFKGANLCANPEPVAKHLVSRGFYKNHDMTLQLLRDVPYARWRDFDSEDTVRYYALRLHEAGMIKSNPQKILAEATDFRFLNELKKELKA